MWNRRSVLRGAAVLLSGTAARAALAQPARALDKLVVAGWSKPITEITNLLVDAEKGFFRNRGIELVYVPGAGGGDAVRNLLSGQADVAFTDPGSLFAALDKGEKLVAIYDIYPQNVFNVVSLKSRGIRRPADLAGKRVGVYSLSSGTRQNLQLLLSQAGLTEADITLVVTGLLNFAPLIQGQVDATAATDTGLLIGRRHGLGEVDVMEVRNILNISSDLFVIREEALRQRRDLLHRFVAAYRESAQWMIDSPAEAAQLATRHAIDGQDLALDLEIIGLRNQSAVSGYTRQHGLGAIDDAMMRQAIDAYRRIGVLHRDLKVADIVDHDLLRAS
jgi:NitT/TauT family transport system substrate-binding protein